MTANDDVHEATPEEGRRIFRDACQRELGITPEEYFSAKAGWGPNPDVWPHDAYIRVYMLEPFWSDGPA